MYRCLMLEKRLILLLLYAQSEGRNNTCNYLINYLSKHHNNTLTNNFHFACTLSKYFYKPGTLVPSATKAIALTESFR